MVSCSLQTDTCQVSEWAARLESGATVKIQRNEEVTPSGYLKRALAHLVDGKRPHTAIMAWVENGPSGKPKGLLVWDETGVTKTKSQSCVALTTAPGSLEASVHAALQYVILLRGAEAPREQQLPTAAQ